MSKENGMMAAELEQDGAINLTTSKEEQHAAAAAAAASSSAAAVIANGDGGSPDVSSESQENIQSSPINNTSISYSPPKQNNVTSSSTPKRKKQSMIDSGQQQPLLMMGPQQGLTPQQMQQILQQQMMAGPQQLQQIMQQQSMLFPQMAQQKFQEHVVQQLQEQLQMNVLQQTQLIQQANTADKKQNNKHIQVQLQQLALQQQQIIQQLQLQQRQYLLSQGMGLQGLIPQGMSQAEMMQLWKEVTAAHSGEESIKSSANGLAMTNSPTLMSMAPGALMQGPNPHAMGNGMAEGFIMAGGLMTPMAGMLKTPDECASPNTHPLHGHGVCKWPGCDTPSDDFAGFLKHLNSEHVLDDRSTAQARVQMQVVSQLELQLAKERERLQAMMQHLHMKPHMDMKQQQQQQQQQQSMPQLPSQQPQQQSEMPVTPVLPKAPSVTMAAAVSLMTPTMQTSPTIPTTSAALHHQQPPPITSSSPPHTPTSAGGPIRRRVSDKCNLPISAEIQRNRDFYKNTDVRPPFTYASLIRQSIIESQDRQLTLNEIYNWFQDTFAFFRKNQATWKNAVRHNLSLHKCFMRVENVKGAVWTVDEIEFYKRRPQKMSGNLQLKSPSMHPHSPTLYGESLNASLRAALAESNLPLLTNSVQGMESAEDLSMAARSLAHEAQHGNGDMSPNGMFLDIKRESNEDSNQARYEDDSDEGGIRYPPGGIELNEEVVRRLRDEEVRRMQEEELRRISEQERQISEQIQQAEEEGNVREREGAEPRSERPISDEEEMSNHHHTEANEMNSQAHSDDEMET